MINVIGCEVMFEVNQINVDLDLQARIVGEDCIIERKLSVLEVHFCMTVRVACMPMNEQMSHKLEHSQLLVKEAIAGNSEHEQSSGIAILLCLTECSLVRNKRGQNEQQGSIHQRNNRRMMN